MISARRVNSFSCSFGVHLWAIVTVASPATKKAETTMIRKALMCRWCKFWLIHFGEMQENMQILWLGLISGMIGVVGFNGCVELMLEFLLLWDDDRKKMIPQHLGEGQGRRRFEEKKGESQPAQSRRHIPECVCVGCLQITFTAQYLLLLVISNVEKHTRIRSTSQVLSIWRSADHQRAPQTGMHPS